MRKSAFSIWLSLEMMKEIAARNEIGDQVEMGRIVKRRQKSWHENTFTLQQYLH